VKVRFLKLKKKMYLWNHNFKNNCEGQVLEIELKRRCISEKSALTLLTDILYSMHDLAQPIDLWFLHDDYVIETIVGWIYIPW